LEIQNVAVVQLKGLTVKIISSWFRAGQGWKRNWSVLDVKKC